MDTQGFILIYEHCIYSSFIQNLSDLLFPNQEPHSSEALHEAVIDVMLTGRTGVFSLGLIVMPDHYTDSPGR